MDHSLNTHARQTKQSFGPSPTVFGPRSDDSKSKSNERDGRQSLFSLNRGKSRDTSNNRAGDQFPAEASSPPMSPESALHDVGAPPTGQLNPQYATLATNRKGNQQYRGARPQPFKYLK